MTHHRTIQLTIKVLISFRKISSHWTRISMDISCHPSYHLNKDKLRIGWTSRVNTVSEPAGQKYCHPSQKYAPIFLLPMYTASFWQGWSVRSSRSGWHWNWYRKQAKLVSDVVHPVSKQVLDSGAGVKL